METVSCDEDVDSRTVFHAFELTTNELFDSLTWNKPKINAFVMWNKFFRRQLLKGVHSNNYKYAQDRDFNMRLFLKEPKTVFVDNVLYWWFRHSSASMKNEDYQFVAQQSETRYSFKNLNSLQGDKVRYRHFFLDNIYNSMPVYLELANKTEGEAGVSNECAEIFNKTWWQYLLYSNRPMHKRLKRLAKTFVRLF